MKKIFYILFFTLIFISCEKMSEEDRLRLYPYEFSSQEYYDKAIHHNIITDSAGHTLIFHEVGIRDCRNYAFSIEHSPECELCCKIYD